MMTSIEKFSDFIRVFLKNNRKIKNKKSMLFLSPPALLSTPIFFIKSENPKGNLTYKMFSIGLELKWQLDQLLNWLQ